MPTIAVFDFLSHAHMHLPFNEGYLRVVRAAFPGDDLLFHADAAHVEQLRPLVADIPGLTLLPGKGFAVWPGYSRHHPMAGRAAALECLAAMRAAIGSRTLRLAAVLGADANLHRQLRRRWTGISEAPLHIILHNHVAVATQWRSRNPWYRMVDMLSELRRGLPPRIRLLALERGIDESIATLVPALRGRIDTLDHPILERDWVADAAPAAGALQIAFLGNAGVDKGFDRFAAIAARCAGPSVRFHAIGLRGFTTDARLDTSGLDTQPSADIVPRAAYVAQLAGCDAVCLPLTRIYDYVASGSVIDAIAGLKPLFCIDIPVLRRMWDRYGPLGVLAPDADALAEAICGLTRERFQEQAAAWEPNLRRVRDARIPAHLAPGYAATVAAAAAS